MAKIKCQKCGERNDPEDKKCSYYEEILKIKPKTKSEHRFHFVKKPKFYIPSAILAVILVGIVSLLFWKPGIARGEYSFNDIVKMLSGQEKSIENLETKNAPNAPGDQNTPVPTTTVKPNTSPVSGTVPKPNVNGDFHISKVCKDIVIPYETKYYNDSSMDVGDTRVGIVGTNGVKKDCTKTYDGKDWTQYYGLVTKDTYDAIWPRSALVYVGTKIPTSDPSNTPSRNYDPSQCSVIAMASGTGSSAYQYCIQHAYSN